MFRFPEPLLVQKPEDEVMTARLEPRRQETEVSYVMSVSVRYIPVYGALGCFVRLHEVSATKTRASSLLTKVFVIFRAK
jgi:hypothetical protein